MEKENAKQLRYLWMTVLRWGEAESLEPDGLGANSSSATN